jgi:hypothetical protein
MPSYRVRNLGAETPPLERQRLQDAFLKIPGVRKVQVMPVRHEIKFTFLGKEPAVGALKEACESAGFMLGKKT